MTGKEIEQLRQQLGLTQEQFADRLNVAFCTVNRWERERTKPSRLALREIERLKAASGKEV